MPEDFVRDMILLYSHDGGSVWDGCCGSGTVPRVARELHRDGWGTDVNPKADRAVREAGPDGAGAQVRGGGRKAGQMATQPSISYCPACPSD